MPATFEDLKSFVSANSFILAEDCSVLVQQQGERKMGYIGGDSFPTEEEYDEIAVQGLKDKAEEAEMKLKFYADLSVTCHVALKQKEEEMKIKAQRETDEFLDRTP